MASLDPSAPPQKLRAHWLRTGLPPALYVVVAQGLCPGRQTINRAELLALYQARQIAAQMPDVPCTIWSDSSYALRVGSGDTACHRSHLDLVPSTSLPVVPTFKVKSHVNPENADESALHAVLGNVAADSAARTAGSMELECAVHDAQSAAAWHLDQDAMFDRYCDFLQRLTSEVMRLREGMDPEVARSLWIAGNPVGLPTMGIPTGYEAKLVRMCWPPWFTQAVVKWAAGLGWPAVSSDDPARGITYLELMANFVVVTGVCTPAVVGPKHARQYVDPASDEGFLLPLSVREFLVTFVAAIQSLSRSLGVSLLQGRTFRRVTSLSSWPSEPPYRKGRLARPALTASQGTADLLWRFSCSRNAEVFREVAMAASLREGRVHDSSLHARWSHFCARRNTR